jgi:hypothetical protein
MDAAVTATAEDMFLFTNAPVRLIGMNHTPKL